MWISPIRVDAVLQILLHLTEMSVNILISQCGVSLVCLEDNLPIFVSTRMAFKIF